MNTKQNISSDKALQDALSPLVNNIIHENYESTKDEMTAHLAPLMGSAIKEQIKSQKDDVVDALYPVIGNMISRYVSKSLEEMLSNINAQIQSGLSAKNIKRKIKAKVKGISETELLLNENANSHIRAIFLIHKDTGIVLAQAQNPNYALHEPDMIASMMTAIRSFVNDCISQDGQMQELGEIEYSGNKIILEASSHAYLAVMVEGASYQTTYEKIRVVFGDIISNHSDRIREFSGDLEKFSQLQVETELAKLLLNEPQEENEKTKVHPLMYIIPLLLLSFGAYHFYYSYINDSITKEANHILYKTPQLTSYRLHVQIDDGIATIEGEVPFSYYKDLALNKIKDIKDIKSVHNNIVILPTLGDPFQISSNISYLLKGFNLQRGVSVNYAYDYETLTLTGHTSNVEQKEQLFQVIKKIHGIQNIHNNIKIIPLSIEESIYFGKGFTTIEAEEERKLVKVIEILHHNDNNNTLVINSYTDLIGNTTKNSGLSKKRIQNVVNFLQKQGNISNPIIVHENNEAPPGIDPVEKPYKARCVTILYQKDKTDDSL